MAVTDSSRDQFFEELSAVRGQPEEGGNSIRIIEKLGAVMVPVQFYEPDAQTSHTEYYYNARLNILYKRKRLNQFYAIWQPMNII